MDYRRALVIVVLLVAFILATGQVSVAVLGGPAGAMIGMTVGLYRVDRARRTNLRKAQDAGLI